MRKSELRVKLKSKVCEGKRIRHEDKRMRESGKEPDKSQVA